MKYEVTTNEIMEFLQEHMVMKEDAKNFLTKEDAKNFLTKEDAKNFLTKEDAKNFVTKKDLEVSFAQSEHRLKSYIDDKLADYTSDIFKRLDKKYKNEKQIHVKIIELFKKHNIGSSEELAYLEGLVSGE